LSTSVRIQIPQQHASQAAKVMTAKRFNVADCARRWGKSLLGEELLITPAIEQGRPTAWFAPSYKLLSPVWRSVKAKVKPLTTDVSAQERRIGLRTGGVIDMWTMSEDPGRGRKYARVVIDEAALQSNLLDVWNSDIRPTLTDYEGDAWFFSTPQGRNGFWQLWQMGQDPDDSEWKSWAPSPTSENPYIPADEIESARRTLPERIFEQEYLAEFKEGGAGVFRKIREAAIATPQAPEVGHEYLFGVDWGKHNDFTVITVLDLATKCMVYIDRFNQIDYAVQRGRLEALAGRYNPVTIIAETNSMGEPIIEELQRSALPVRGFTTTNASKVQAIEALALAFEQGSIEILNDSVLIGELQAYEMKRSPSGMTTYSAPEGMHDDTVMSLALAWQGMDVPTGSPFAIF